MSAATFVRAAQLLVGKMPLVGRLLLALRWLDHGSSCKRVSMFNQRHVFARAWLVARTAAVIGGLPFVVAVVLAATILGLGVAPDDASEAAGNRWDEHLAQCKQLPEELYRQDRSRAVRGIVSDDRGHAVAGALVQCISLQSLAQLATCTKPAPALWSRIVEMETRTDRDGRYEFPALSVGCRTICASAPGLAPDVQSMIVVQDGSGARVDFNLASPKTLRIRLDEESDSAQRIHLVPFRWWPELLSRELAAGETTVEFTQLGGPFQRGLVLVSGLASESTPQVKAAFDLDESNDVVIARSGDFAPSPSNLPEVASALPWQPGMSEAGRMFFSLLSPVALFWKTEVPSKITSSPQRGECHAKMPAGSCVLRGYGPNAFLPVLIESRDGSAWLEWTSNASEFELSEAPAGIYRVRAMNFFGRISFARGAVAHGSSLVELASAPSDEIVLNEPLSRQVMGTVRWEDGRPAADAQIFVQDSASFRRFLQHAATDRNGFFSISNVPSGQYVAFALPPKDDRAMKSFVYPRVESMPRETWLDFTLSPHRIIGRLPENRAVEGLELVREDEDGAQTVVWLVAAGENRQFEITNVPHGRYVVRTTSQTKGATSIASLPVVIERDVTAVVRWAE